MHLSELAKIIHGQLQGADGEWAEVNTDTRQLQPGQLFLAIKGERFDAHDFVEQAEKVGAVAAVVSHCVPTKLPLIIVDDTLQALAEIAQHRRQQYHCPGIAVTGSCGKTTTKMLLAQIFSQCGVVLAPPASFNNHIGVPLTLLQLKPEHDFLITELGANHPGEIGVLAAMVKPQVAIVTNVASVHLEGFGDIVEIARTKGQIYQSLLPNGVAVINADDDFADYWRQVAGSHRIVTFGIETEADIMAKQIRLDSKGRPSFQLSTPQDQCEVNLPLMGRHNVYNALAAAAAAVAQDIELESIRRGLESAQAVNKRLVEYSGKAGAIIIDDTYNANPASMLAAIQLLTQRSTQSILVMGDMMELGKDADEFHRRVGEQARDFGVKQLFCLGKHSALAAQAFGGQGVSFGTHEELIHALTPHLRMNVTVLVKGSRAMTMEKVVEAIREGK